MAIYMDEKTLKYGPNMDQNAEIWTKNWKIWTKNLNIYTVKSGKNR